MRSVQRTLDLLEESGVITLHRSKTDQGDNEVNVYQLNLDVLELPKVKARAATPVT